MPWPFSRNDPESADRQAGEGAARRAEARDPAAELRSQSRRRLIGAAVLLLAAVIVLPLLLDTTPRPVREDIAITVATPSPPPPKPVDNAAPPDEKIAEPAPVRSDPPPAEEPPPPTAAPQVPQVPQAPPAKPAAAAPAERFAVQVAALSSPAAAKELAGRLKKGGFGAYVEAVSTAEGTLHRVRVGPFAGRDEAQRAAEKVKAAGHKATVVGG
jgi:DedD protein